jgi:homoserine dehydrogenase
MRLILVGFGTVGQGLAQILRDHAASLQNRYGFRGQIVAVATRQRGTLYHPDGLDVDHLLAAIEQGHLDHYPHIAGLWRGDDTLGLIRQAQADVVVEASYTDLQTAQPALAYCYAALETGKHVVMANKGPVSLAYTDLKRAAQAAGRYIGFEATVMAGTPALRLALEALAGCQITQARGILNGTTNYILTQMESGLSYEAALQQAQSLGYAEADPTADVDGWDAAGKATILMNVLFGRRPGPLGAIAVRGIREITPGDIEEARSRGQRWKLVATITPQGGQVQPVSLPMIDPLANVAGATNAITYTTDLLGDVTLVGPGAGRLQTGFGLLADLLAIQRLYA